MAKLRWTLLAALVALGTLRAEEPPYKRLLQGDDAKKAAALAQRIDELWVAGRVTEALAPAEELAALRKRVQGEGHWEAAEAARLLDMLRQVAAARERQRTALGEALGMAAKAAALESHGKYAEAEPLRRKAPAIWKEVLGPRHSYTPASYNSLAFNLQTQGRTKEADPLYHKVVAIYEEVLGPRHPSTASSYNNLARNLQAQGRAKEAESLYRKALAVYEEALGPQHADTATSCYNLAANLQAQGRTKEAEPLHRQALSVREEVLGPRHPQTAASYNNLAVNLQGQGRAQEAEPLFRKALAVWEEVLGPQHSNTAFSYNNLATNLDAQGRAQEAEPLYRKVLTIREEVLGPRHPDTARSYVNLASNLRTQGRAQEAEPLLRKALVVWEEVLGPRHPDTATSYNNLALNLQAQGRAKEGEPLCRKALAVREEALGLRHPDTANSYNNLAYNLEAQERTQEAEPLFRKALAVREEVLGPRHPDTARSYSNLAANLQAQGRAKEAEPLLRKALAVWEEGLGPRHPNTATSYNYLASNLLAQGRAKEAEPFSRKALAISEQALGPRHPETATRYNNFAYNLQVQGRDKEAEPLWQAGTDAVEAARLRLAASALDKAAAFHLQPHLGLALCRARLQRPHDAWTAAEAGLARGLLDDLAARAGLPPDAAGEQKDHDRAARLDALDRLLLPLLAAAKLDESDRHRRDALLKQRQALDDAVARAAAERSARSVLPLDAVQAQLAPDAALVFWLDWSTLGDHWGCVVRRSGPPAWVRLTGSGDKDAWTPADDRLPRLLRDDLARGEPDADRHSRRLADQRLAPFASHLAATAGLPVVRHLVVVPVGSMAGVPIEALTDRYLVSYAPSGTVFARLRRQHRPLEAPTLLALGDPNFSTPDAGPPSHAPDHGLYLALVLPGSNAGHAGLRAGDVLLRYGDAKLSTKADLKMVETGARVPVVVWRDGKLLDDLRVSPGKLGVVISEDSPAVALRKRRDLDLLADARTRDDAKPLPGTRLEVAAIAALLPKGKATLLLGSQASEQELDALVAAGRLKQFRLLHLATHGQVDPVSAARSSLLLARDRLPGLAEQERLTAAGKKVPRGRLWVETIANHWELDADLVVLSACETAIGPDGGGEGLLGFSQVLLGRRARSLLLSLWKVEDTATALLMTRFYQNLLCQREGLSAPLPKAEALREAKNWLRALPRAEVEKLAGQLARGVVRASEEAPPKSPPREASRPVLPPGAAPFAHPRYWAAFILIGDPE
jgi:tetratricopeptide (TPR) repeat protein